MPQSSTDRRALVHSQAVGFAVQIAAFQGRRKAEGLQTTLQDRGYPAYVVEAEIPDSGRHYRVRVGPFDTKEEAREVASNIQDRFPREVPDFWILSYQE